MRNLEYYGNVVTNTFIVFGFVLAPIIFIMWMAYLAAGSLGLVAASFLMLVSFVIGISMENERRGKHDK
jgi:uncharacterized membrane protein